MQRKEQIIVRSRQSLAVFKIIEFRYCVKVGSKLILQR
nr:MAG TPA: hypothetical protein [Caudoviricetes sp.]